MQRPWLLVSLVAYISAFLGLVCGHENGEIVGLHIATDLIIAFGSMLGAGVHGEEDPPYGAHGIVNMLKRIPPSVNTYIGSCC